MSEFIITLDAYSMAQTAAEQFVTRATEAIDQRGQFVVALSGGSTPRPTYALLAGEPLASRVDWSHVHIFWSDERCVPPTHPDSNYRMAREALLDHIDIPTENVHRIKGELGAVQAAAAYRSELDDVLGRSARFDLILLGVGADGHTASLFPGTAATKESRRTVVAVHVEKLDAWRVTLTLPVINRARHVTFLVSGASKAKALARVRNQEPLPAGLVQPRGQLIWIVDQDALEAL